MDATESRGPQLATTAIVFVVLCTLFGLLRTWVRVVIQKHGFFIDDWFMVVGLLFLYAFTALDLVAISRGAGKHTFSVDTHDIIFNIKIWWIVVFVYLAACFFLRLSIGALFLRVIPAHSLSYSTAIRWSIYSILIFNLMVTVAFALFMALSCQPASYFWTRFEAISDGSCIPIEPYKQALQAFTALSGVVDLGLAIIPGAIVWQLQMRKRTKVWIHTLMALGCICSIGNFARLPYFATSLDSLDFLYEAAPLTLWSNIELGLGFVAICAAALRPLLRAMKVPFVSPQNSDSPQNAPPTIGAKNSKWRPNRFSRRISDPEDQLSLHNLTTHRPSMIAEPGAMLSTIESRGETEQQPHQQV